MAADSGSIPDSQNRDLGAPPKNSFFLVCQSDVIFLYVIDYER
jgi:hypothetical protein